MLTFARCVPLARNAFPHALVVKFPVILQVLTSLCILLLASLHQETIHSLLFFLIQTMSHKYLVKNSCFETRESLV